MQLGQRGLAAHRAPVDHADIVQPLAGFLAAELHLAFGALADRCALTAH